MAYHKRNLDDKEVEPILMLPDLLGGHFPEHIPSSYNRFVYKVKSYNNTIRDRLGANIYYWHVRHWFNPKDRKKYDLQFLLHVEKDHEGKPQLPIEKFHHHLAQANYRREIDMIKNIDLIEWRLEHSKDVYLQKDLYLKAYKKKWLDSFDESPDWKLLYHGVPYYELLPLLDKVIDTVQRRRKHYRKFIKFNDADE